MLIPIAGAVPWPVVALAAALAAVPGAVVGAVLGSVVARVPGASPPGRPALAASTALAFALVVGGAAHAAGGAEAGWTASAVAVVLVAGALVWLAAATIVLAIVDIETRRLPDAIVLPCYLSGILLLGAAAAVSGDLAAAARAGVGLVALGGFYLVLRVWRPDGMGGGDVKLAGVLGLHLGWAGWAPLVVGATGAFLLGGLASIAVMASRRGGRRATIAFGPWMIAAAWIGVAWGDALMPLYTGPLGAS